MVSFCHVTLQDHMIRSSLSCLYGYKPLKVCHHPTTFGGHRQYGSGDVMVLVCHVISQENVMKRSYDFIGRTPSRQVTIL